jgi:hypothetical protein
MLVPVSLILLILPNVQLASQDTSLVLSLLPNVSHIFHTDTNDKLNISNQECIPPVITTMFLHYSRLLLKRPQLPRLLVLMFENALQDSSELYNLKLNEFCSEQVLLLSDAM